MSQKYYEFADEVKHEFDHSSEKKRRTKYLMNPNYVYEPFGWENQ